MTTDDLDIKLEELIGEMRSSYEAIRASHESLTARLDGLDLNGTAKHLREFGRFLGDHPDFMKREAEQETRRVRQEIALEWIADILHLRDFRKKMAWTGTALLTGVLLAFGNTVVQFLGEINTIIHALGHMVFR